MRREAQSAGGSTAPRECDGRFPFASADRPSEDVASPEIEAALGDLERALCRDRSNAVVVAPPGPEGALLLRVLMKRLPGFLRAVHVTTPTFGEDEICARILGALQHDPGGDAEARLLGFAQELARRDSALVLLIGDAGAMQTRTLACLGRLAKASRSGLRLVLLVAIEPRSDASAIAELVAALGVGAEKLVLRTRVEQTQTGAPARRPLEHSEPDGAIPPLATARAPGAAGPDRSAERGGPGSRFLDESNRAAQPRLHGFRARGWPLAATVALGIALALLGAQLRLAPTLPPEAVPEPGPLAGRVEPAESREAPSTPPAPSRPEAKLAGPDDAIRFSKSARPAVTERPVGKIRPALATPVRPIRVSLNARPWARIEVDGREVGITPLADLPLAPGLHRFRAHHADGRVVERAIRVDAYRNHISFP